jgi:hypothetical protein
MTWWLAMCNFHESVAVSAATDPLTGKVHAGHRAVIRVALSRYWASNYVDGAENVDGYNFYPLATRDQQLAFERSGLKRPLAEVQQEEIGALDYLRTRISELEKHQDLSPKALALPLPTAREAFMDMAIDHIYEGDPKIGLQIVSRVDRNDLKPLHAAVSDMHSDPKTSHILERLVQGKICTLYSEAPQRVNKSLMSAYEGLPERVKDVSGSVAKYGGNVVLGGFSGMIGHGIHYASVLGAGVAAGTASSVNLALSGVFLLASYGGWHQAFGGQYKSAKDKAGAFAVQAALAFVVATGAQQFISHDHMSSEKAEWYQSLPPKMKESLLSDSNQTYKLLPTDLRQRLDDAAEKEGIPPGIFLIICGGNDPITRDINAYMSARSVKRESMADGPK